MFYVVCKSGSVCYSGEDSLAAMEAIAKNPGCKFARAHDMDSFLTTITSLQKETNTCHKGQTFEEIKAQMAEELKADGIEVVDFDTMMKQIKVESDALLANIKTLGVNGATAIGDVLTNFGSYLQQLGKKQ